MWNNLGFNRDEPCDVPCKYTTSIGNTDGSVYENRGYTAPSAEDTLSIYMQMEGEHYYPIDMKGYQVENSYRWSSDILKPYFEWLHYHDETNIQNARVSPDAIDGVSFLARNCGSQNSREQLVKDLIAANIRVDSMSSCLHNHEMPAHAQDNKVKIMGDYKFHAAFENGNVRDYVTEKVYLALASGTLPIYLGTANIDEFVPKGSIIRVDSFNSTVELAEHLKACMANETLYQSYHEWRSKPIDEAFMDKFAFTNVSTECRTCRYLSAEKQGLPWNKKTQHFKGHSQTYSDIYICVCVCVSILNAHQLTYTDSRQMISIVCVQQG